MAATVAPPQRLLSQIDSAIPLQGIASEWKRREHPQLYKSRGAQYQHAATTFRVYAPNATEVSVHLTAYGRTEHACKMHPTGDGSWEVTTANAQPNRTYLYQITDSLGKVMLRTDPFSFSTTNVPECGQIQSVVVDPLKHCWEDHAWLQKRATTNPLESPLCIYEIQPKSWKSGYSKPLNFREMVPEIVSYCKKMGFTHVECYGLLDHYFKEARGYQVSNFFAPYSGSGSCDDFKYFVDQLHQNNIGVLIDWIPTHFQHYHQSDSYSVSLHKFDGTDLFAAEDSPWGTLYLDYQKEETRRLMLASALYYLEELHVDGIRFDAISQMVHRDKRDIPSGISFLQELNNTIHSCYPGVMTIAEETEGFPRVTWPTEEGGLGFDVKWDIGWSHNSRHFLQTPYQERSHPQHWQDKVIRYLRSHGEKVMLTHSHDDTDSGEGSNAKVLLNCVSHLKEDQEKFSNLRNFFALQTTLPSYGHMIHMGDELLQSDSWYQRFRKNVSSVDWSLPERSPAHHQIQEYISDLNALYFNNPQFWERGAQKTTELLSEYGPNAVVAYHRGTKDGKRLAVVHNFLNKGYSTYDVPLPSNDIRIQRIKELFNSDHPKYGGSGTFMNHTVEIVRNHIRLSLPPNATVVLEEDLTNT